ncbi:acylphosphatase-2 [Bacillus rossius redtenbacheri]|uniref:acylphosphatase-2 n=1 Tax=Bacillus rossius redtenbacheri TaxID=93214 RepID=UPI002FDCCFD7
MVTDSNKICFWLCSIEMLRSLFVEFILVFCNATILSHYTCMKNSLTIDTMADAVKLIALEFEVFGRVQGVFFRKYTQGKARELGLRGWCMNTEKNTVKGEIQGDPRKVQEMKHWLSKVGSPSSRIDKAEFKKEKEISDCTFSDFKIRH